MRKTLVEKPELEIESRDDRVWLHFRCSTGESANLELATMYGEQTGIVAASIVRWCKEYSAAPCRCSGCGKNLRADEVDEFGGHCRIVDDGRGNVIPEHCGPCLLE